MGEVYCARDSKLGRDVAIKIWPDARRRSPGARWETLSFYDVSSDGQRFLMLKPTEQSTSLTQIDVVQNWSEELKRLAPPGR